MKQRAKYYKLDDNCWYLDCGKNGIWRIELSFDWAWESVPWIGF